MRSTPSVWLSSWPSPAAPADGEYDGPGERAYCVVADVLFSGAVSPEDVWEQIRDIVRGRHETRGDGWQVNQTSEITSMRVDFCVTSDFEAPELQATLAALPNLIASISFTEALDPADA